jgi:hypothetical protein
MLTKIALMWPVIVKWGPPVLVMVSQALQAIDSLARRVNAPPPEN